jgi:hypothetical protein
MTTPTQLTPAQLTQLFSSTNTTPPTKSTSSGFFEALARAWGEALDKQAQVISDQSQALNVDGNDTMSAVTELTAESSRMSFLANSSHTSLSESGEALKAVAQK